MELHKFKKTYHSRSSRENHKFQNTWSLYLCLTFIALCIFFNFPDYELGNIQIKKSKTPEERVQRIAWAIPVGGRTKRNDNVRMIVHQLLTSGAPPNTVFIFEDDSGRPQADKELDKIADEFHINLYRTNVPRFGREPQFGLFLARHYKAMFKTIFKGATGIFDFMVFIEDDLIVSPDAVAYFTAMSFVMEQDPTIFCVSAHNDNAIPANSININSRVGTSQPGQFLFRRGEHFMAPGWMTSITIYYESIYPRWFDSSGYYLDFKSLRMPNGNWDAYMEARMRAGPSGNFTHFAGMDAPFECIYPELPRVSHHGGEGYTISNERQMFLFDNLLLSQYDPRTQLTFPYIVDNLVADKYENQIRNFIKSAVILSSMAEVALYRQTSLVLQVNAMYDNDNKWNIVLGNEGFELLVGIGGHPGFDKPRGIHRGAVFVRRLTNILLIVGQYSEYASLVPKIQQDSVINGATHMGCFKDKWKSRDLPHYISDSLFFQGLPLTPRTCVIACMNRGFPVAGLQFGGECWCGNAFGSYGRLDDSKLCDTCKVADTAFKCGGALINAIYLSTPKLSHRFHPSNKFFEKASKQQSCDDACALRGKVCDPQLLAVLSHNCKALKNMFGCDKCHDPPSIPNGWATPSFDLKTKKCVVSKINYLRCDYAPRNEFRRACVCVMKENLVI